MKTGTKLAAGACAAVIAGAVAIGAGSSAFASNAELKAGTEDLFKPGNEMLFTAECDEPSATLTTSFGASTTLLPAADAGQLIGTITAPDQIGPGPDDGYQTYTVKCGDKEKTFRFSNDTNGAK